MARSLQRPSAACLLGYFSAALLTFVSVSASARYALGGAETTLDKTVAVAGVLALEGVLIATVSVIAQGTLARRFFALTLFLVACTVAVGNAIGYAHHKHNLAVTTRATQANVADDAAARVAELQQSLRAFDQVRPSATIQADAQACAKRGCDRWRAYRSELEMAERRDAIVANLEIAKGDLKNVASSTITDPMSQAIVDLAAPLYKLTPAAVGLYMVTLWSVFLQVAPALLFAVVKKSVDQQRSITAFTEQCCSTVVPNVASTTQIGGTQTERCCSTVEQQRSIAMEQQYTVEQQRSINAVIEQRCSTVMQKDVSTRQEDSTRIVQPCTTVDQHCSAKEIDAVTTLVRAKGGSVLSSQAKIADQLGVDRRRAIRMIKAAATSGALVVIANRRGTQLELPGARRAAGA